LYLTSKRFPHAQLNSIMGIGYSFPHFLLIHFKYDLSCNATLVVASNLKIRNLAKFYCYLDLTFLNFLNGYVNYQLFW